MKASFYDMSRADKSTTKGWSDSEKNALKLATDKWTDDFRKQLKSAYSSDVDPGKLLKDSSEEKHPLPEVWEKILPKSDQISSVDGKSLIASGGIQNILAANNLIKGPKNDPGTSVLVLDENFAQAMIDAYYPFRQTTSSSNEVDRIRASEFAIDLVASNAALSSVTLVNEGDAGFGVPLAFTAKEKTLSVEPSLEKRFDIYWLELAVSPSEELLSNVSEIKYNVKIETANSLALDLVPARYGTPKEIKEETKTPSVKAGDVEVGEIFKRTVSYKFMQPTVLSRGVLTAEFGWIFMDQALDASAKRMFAVIGVPKGIKSVRLALSLSVKCTRYLGLESQWASTNPRVYSLQLPN